MKGTRTAMLGRVIARPEKLHVGKKESGKGRVRKRESGEERDFERRKHEGVGRPEQPQASTAAMRVLCMSRYSGLRDLLPGLIKE